MKQQNEEFGLPVLIIVIITLILIFFIAVIESGAQDGLPPPPPGPTRPVHPITHTPNLCIRRYIPDHPPDWYIELCSEYLTGTPTPTQFREVQELVWPTGLPSFTPFPTKEPYSHIDDGGVFEALEELFDAR